MRAHSVVAFVLHVRWSFPFVGAGGVEPPSVHHATRLQRACFAKLPRSQNAEGPLGFSPGGPSVRSSYSARGLRVEGPPGILRLTLRTDGPDKGRRTSASRIFHMRLAAIVDDGPNPAHAHGARGGGGPGGQRKRHGDLMEMLARDLGARQVGSSIN